MSDKNDLLFGSVPLQYSALIKDSWDDYLYSSNTGLWQTLDTENEHLLSLIPPTRSHEDFRVIDQYSVIKSNLKNRQNSRTNTQFDITVSDSRNNEPIIDVSIFNQESSKDVNAEHLNVLKNYSKFDFKALLVDVVKFKSIFNPNSEPSSLFQSQLTELASFCNVEILISSRVEHFSLPHNTTEVNDNSNRGSNIYIYILGDSDNTIFAETRLRILMDTHLGFFVDSVDIPLSNIPLVGGVNFGNFKSIAKETGVNLYLPTVLPELYNNEFHHNLDVIFLSGLESQVLLAKKLFLDLKSKLEVYYKNIKILQFKKDHIILNRKNDLSAIMYKYGVFLQISPLGHDSPVVHFSGLSSELIELAIEDFISLTNDIYQTNVWFYPQTNGEQKLDLISNQQDLAALLVKISIASNSLIYANYVTGAYQFIASQHDSVKAVKLLQIYSSQVYKHCNHVVKFNIELGLPYHDFISGKKNGKISKIMNSFKSTKIQFQPLNEYSLLIELKSDSFNEFLDSFAQLQNEFPSEYKFYIPESFHRQIIGTGGSLIQSIMRKYNVFVKFSNSYDLKNNSRNHVRYDNVIIRCPSKNSSNIPMVKNELNGLLINNENISFFNTFFKISRNQYRLLDFNKIQEIEKKTSTFIKFPTSEPQDFTIVEVLGVENHSINATRLITQELAESYEIKITYSSKFNEFFNQSNETYLDKIKIPFRLLYNFEILTVDGKSADSGPYHSIILSYQPENETYLKDAIAYVTSFLREFNFTIIDRGELSNNDLIINGSAARYGSNAILSDGYAEGGKNFGNLNNPFGSNHNGKFGSNSNNGQIPLQTNRTFQQATIHQQVNQNQRSSSSQPLKASQNYSYNTTDFKKRPATYNGYDNTHRDDNIFIKRPF